jgi:hypothetical protein
MSTKSAFSVVGLAHKVCLAAEEQGYTPELLNTLAEDPALFRKMLYVQRGYAEVKAGDGVVDLDANPFIPRIGWEVDEHQKGGFFKWNQNQAQPYSAKQQKNGKVTQGYELRRELEGKRVFNANLLDYLFAHPHLIPEKWKQDKQGRTRYIFFWGTIYRDEDCDLYVRYLYWDGSKWDCGYRWLAKDWGVDDPAILRLG